MTMKYSFAELGQNILTRKFGGTTVGVADPYVTGYHFIWFDKIPPGLALRSRLQTVEEFLVHKVMMQ